MVSRVAKGSSISPGGEGIKGEGDGAEGGPGGGGGGGEVIADGDGVIVSACHHGAWLRARGAHPRGPHMPVAAASSAAGSVSSRSVRASVTRDLQHGGAEEKQEAQRCKRRIWARIAGLGYGRADLTAAVQIARSRAIRRPRARETCQCR